jgi:hypothetical protein
MLVMRAEGCRDRASWPVPQLRGRVPGRWREIIPGGHPEAAVTVKFTVTIRQVLDDGGEAALEGELEAALAGPAEQFAGLAAWTAGEARYLDHGEREKLIADEGRRLQQEFLQATFRLDAALEERAQGVTSAAGTRHGAVERGCERGLASIFGPATVTRMAYRNRKEPNLYPADARQALPADPYSLGMRTLAARELAVSGFGQAQAGTEERTGVKIGHAQLAGIAATSLAGPATSMPRGPGTRTGTCLRRT